MTVAIITDSTASLAQSRAAGAGITVVPLQVILGAQTYTEGVDVTADMLAEALTNFVPVSTSRPTPEAFGRAYEAAAANGATQIVSVHLSAKVSGTFDSAQLAAKDAPVPVTCVDSAQVGIATGFAALQAVAVAKAGGNAQAAAEAAAVCGAASTTLFYVDTLEYLRRGGRMGAGAALIGSVLAVKPLLTVVDGAITPFEKVRTTAKALARLEALIVERVLALEGATYDIAIQHLASADVAKAVAGRLEAALDRETIATAEVGASIGAHVGPGMVAVTVTPHADSAYVD